MPQRVVVLAFAASSLVGCGTVTGTITDGNAIDETSLTAMAQDREGDALNAAPPVLGRRSLPAVQGVAKLGPIRIAGDVTASGDSDAALASRLAGVALRPLYTQPDESICDVAMHVAGGMLCAIRPSRLDPAARDAYGTSTLADRALGFGYHAILFPDDDRAVRGVDIHLVGSYGRPYDPRLQSFPNETFLAESVDSGHVIISLAYDNRFKVNEETCQMNGAVDDCAGLVRKEKLTGENLTTLANTPLADAIEPRLVRLARYLDEAGVRLPVPLVEGDAPRWSGLRVSGHSQGSGHAYFIAKHHAVARACLLGGPYDVPDSVGTPHLIADWYVDGASATPVGSIRAALSKDDDSYSQFVYAYGVIGLAAGTGYVVIDEATYTDAAGETVSGHSAIMQDPRFASVRRAACFAD